MHIEILTVTVDELSERNRISCLSIFGLDWKGFYLLLEICLNYVVCYLTCPGP